jgi:hypothetical protein
MRENAIQEITVSSSKLIKPMMPFKAQLKSIKNSCTFLQSEQTKVLQSLAQYQQECKSIFSNACLALTNYFTGFMKSHHLTVQKNESARASTIYL